MLYKAVANEQDAVAVVFSMIPEAQSKAWREINKTLIDHWSIDQ